MSKKIFRLVLFACIGLPMLVIALFVIGRLRGASPEQQQALDLLAVKPEFRQQENLASYLWLIAYEVPEDKIQVIADSDAAKFNALDSDEEIRNFVSQAEGRYPTIDYHDEELASYCRQNFADNCLAHIQSDHEKIEALLRSSEKAIARAERIQDFGVHYSPMELHIESPLPKFNAGRQLLRVHYANLFIGGQQELAIEKVCGDMAAWRSIGANTDSLIGSMIGHAYVRQDLGILAEMLIRRDSDAALPESCTLALAPVNYSENMICNAMRGEFGITKNLDVSLVAEPEKQGRIARQLSAKLLYNHQHTVRKAAPFFASSCSIESVNAAKRNQQIALNAEQYYRCDALDWVSNFSGCSLLKIAAPEYSKYSGRRLDQSAEITAMQILLWLREQKTDGGNSESIFLGRPENLKAFSDRIRLDSASGRIEVRLLSPAGDGEKIWSLPLKASSLAK